MTIESAPGRAIISLSREELRCYGIDCARMSLSDERTRLMLGDVLNMLAHMGIISVHSPAGPRVDIDCACGPAGGCMLFVAVSGRRVRFGCADAALRAARAGAFSGDMELVPDGNGYILALPDDIEWWRECLIREFTEESGITPQGDV